LGDIERQQDNDLQKVSRAALSLESLLGALPEYFHHIDS